MQFPISENVLEVQKDKNENKAGCFRKNRKTIKNSKVKLHKNAGDKKKHIAQNVKLTKKEVDKMVEMLFNTNKKSFK